jgi:2-polyprenyl-3-methyl-5-hydroxy-6-metoxy-1,4-benzoquinol methylase
VKKRLERFQVLKTPTGSHPQQQEHVNEYFQLQSSYWQDVYTIRGVQAEIIQDRHTAILNWIDDLELAPGARVLEIGCGAGFMAIALAQRGLCVSAIDSAEAMIDLARQNAVRSGTSPAMLSFEVGDVYSLAYQGSSFDLLIAIGVLPWLDRAHRAVREMARVTKPGGSIILTTANRAGLASLLDPLVNPVLHPLKLRLKRVFVRQPSPAMVFHSSRTIDNVLRRMGFVKVKGMTRGFGFSLFRRAVLPEPLGTALNRRLQHLADRGVFGFRSTGMAYIVLGRKSAS